MPRPDKTDGCLNAACEAPTRTTIDPEATKATTDDTSAKIRQVVVDLRRRRTASSEWPPEPSARTTAVIAGEVADAIPGELQAAEDHDPERIAAWVRAIRGRLAGERGQARRGTGQ